MVHGWFYSLPVASLAPGAIAKRLESIIHDADLRLHSGEEAVPVGVLSSDNRDTWSSNLSYLLSLSPQNQRTFDFLSQSLLVVSLDAHSHTLTTDGHLHAIRSTSGNVENRWFDKAFTLIVDPAARAGAMGEHSPCDALVPSIVAEYGIVEGIDEAQFSDDEPLGEWARLDWVTDARVQEQCDEAYGRAKSLIENSDDSVMWFSDYGADWIKGVGQSHLILLCDAYDDFVVQRNKAPMRISKWHSN